jgi:hypothetical protein
MTDERTSYVDMLRKFGSDLGLPKVDAGQLIETHRKNIDALGQSATVAAQGAQSVVAGGNKACPLLSAAWQTSGQPRPADGVRQKAFEIAVKGAEDSAKTARQSTGKVVKIIQDRLKESLNEIRSGLDRSKSA